MNSRRASSKFITVARTTFCCDATLAHLSRVGGQSSDSMIRWKARPSGFSASTSTRSIRRTRRYSTDLAPHLAFHVTTPFLAPEIVDVAEKLPSKLKADGRVTKPVLKTLAARYFPKEWIYRQNQGFPTPTSRWLEGPLSSWRHALSDERMASRGVMNVAAIRAGDADRNYEAIWTAMTLEMFCRQFIDGEGSPDFHVDAHLRRRV